MDNSNNYNVSSIAFVRLYGKEDVIIRSIISRDTCINHHVTNVQHGSACSCTTLNYCTTWLVVLKCNNIQLQCVVVIVIGHLGDKQPNAVYCHTMELK